MRKDAQPPTGGIYRPRNPRVSPLYQCVRRHSGELDAAGLVHRPVEAEVLERFLDCGDLHKGFARIYCDQCGHDYLLAWSCKTRYFCPGCHQKRMLQWRYSGFSVHNRVRSKDAEGRQRFARYMIRCPFSLEKMRYAPDSGTVIYRSKPHATLKRNYQLMPAIQWLRMLMNHVPDKYEHLVRYYGHYSNRSRGARRLVESADEPAGPIRLDEPPADSRRKASWARLIQKVYEVDKHLDAWDSQPDTLTPAGPDPPLPEGETLPLTYHPVPDIA